MDVILDFSAEPRLGYFSIYPRHFHLSFSCSKPNLKNPKVDQSKTKYYSATQVCAVRYCSPDFSKAGHRPLSRPTPLTHLCIRKKTPLHPLQHPTPHHLSKLRYGFNNHCFQGDRNEQKSLETILTAGGRFPDGQSESGVLITRGWTVKRRLWHPIDIDTSRVSTLRAGVMEYRFYVLDIVYGTGIVRGIYRQFNKDIELAKDMNMPRVVLIFRWIRPSVPIRNEITSYFTIDQCL